MKIKHVRDIKNKYTHNILNYVYIIYSYIDFLEIISNEINNVCKCLTQLENITKKFNRKRLCVDEKLYNIIHQYINETTNIIKNIEQINHNNTTINECLFEIKFLLIQMKDNVKELTIPIENNSDNIFDQQYFKNNNYSKLTNNCWINKNGDVYNCNLYQHSILAEAIKFKIQPTSRYCGEELLEKLGWIKISNGIVMFCGYEMSENQKLILYENNLINSFN